MNFYGASLTPEQTVVEPNSKQLSKLSIMPPKESAQSFYLPSVWLFINQSSVNL